MSNEITNEPEIRFDGYEGDWEQRKWYDTVNMSTDMVDPKEGEYDDLPHIGPGNIESFTGRILNNVKTVREDNLISGKFHFNSGDIIYGKINPQLAKYAYVNFEGLTSADTYVLKSHNGIIQDFLFVILQTKDFYKYSVSVSMRTGMPKINRDELNQYNYLSPSNIDEQRKIGSFFNQLDNTIALHQRELDLLEQLKQTYLQKMFPKTGEDKPEIRFAGFTDAWEQHKIGDVFSERSERGSEGELISVTINSGVIRASELDRKDNSSNDKSNYKKVKVGDIAYNSMRMWQGASGYSSYNGILSPAYTVIIPKEGIDSKFFAYDFKRYDMIQTFKRNSQGLTSDTWNLKFPTLKSVKVMVPCIEEQKKISSFFERFNMTITLHQRELDSLKEMKKSLLQKMFA
ncbi:restriction endonuclease subunit S [Enterococcus hirae]